MEKNLENYRKSYEKMELVEDNLLEDPQELFKKWFDEVEKANAVEEPNAMVLSTVGEDGFPKSRVVLLKSIEKNGYVFYTNYESEKGQAIAFNPKVCLNFFWPAMERQVIVKGTVEKISEEQSRNYFESRPTASQLGALVSPQSQPIANRTELEEKYEELKEKYQGKQIPKPEHWGGYLVKPSSFEFWQGRRSRLHDRFVYSKDENDQWQSPVRLAP